MASVFRRCDGKRLAAALPDCRRHQQGQAQQISEQQDGDGVDIGGDQLHQHRDRDHDRDLSDCDADTDRQVDLAVLGRIPAGAAHRNVPRGAAGIRLFLDLEMFEMLVGDGDAEARQIVIKLQEAVIIGVRVAFEDVVEQLVPDLDIEDRGNIPRSGSSYWPWSDDSCASARHAGSPVSGAPRQPR